MSYFLLMGQGSSERRWLPGWWAELDASQGGGGGHTSQEGSWGHTGLAETVG